MTKKRIIIGVLIALLLIAGVAVNIVAIKMKGTNNSTNLAENVENNTAENENLDLTGEKYKKSDVKDKNGQKISLEADEQKPLIVLYWNNAEEESVEVLKLLQEYYNNYRQDVNFSAVAVIEDNQESKDAINSVITENKIEVPVFYDTDNAAMKANNITKIPALVMVNKKGEIINTLETDMNKDVVEANLDILAENY